MDCVFPAKTSSAGPFPTATRSSATKSATLKSSTFTKPSTLKKWPSVTVIWVSTGWAASSMGIRWSIPMCCAFGKHSLAILPMALARLLTTTWFQVKANGAFSLAWCWTCHMVWTGRDLSTVRPGWKGSCRWVMITVMWTGPYRMSSS